MDKKKYSRKEFLLTLGTMTIATVALKFFNTKQVIHAVTGKQKNQQNTYGNNTYGGNKKA